MNGTKLWYLAVISLLAGSAPSSQVAAQNTRYRLVDIGTLGGPSSYGSVDGPGYKMISSSGIVALGADTSTPDPNAPNCFNPDCFEGHVARWRNGVLADLGALPGAGNSSGAAAINDLGWIIGQSENGATDPITGVPQTAAALWKNDGPINLGNFGGSFTLPLDINNKGQVVGFGTNTTSDPFSIFYLAAFGIGGTQTRAFLWENGILADLGTLGGPDAEALDVNQSGQVVGISYTDPNETPNDSTGLPTAHPFLWDHGKMIDLGTLGGTLSGTPFGQELMLVNDHGQVMGGSTLDGDQVVHAFLWSRGILFDVGTLGGDNSNSVAMNELGEVVGQADLPGSINHHAFLWRKGVLTDLGTLGSTSLAMGINSRGQVVGRSRIGDVNTTLQHAFLWENGGPMVDINDLIVPNPNLVLFEADNINERGEIVATALPTGCDDPGLCGQMVLLVPCGANDALSCENSAPNVGAAPTISALVNNTTTTSAQGRSGQDATQPAWRTRLLQRPHLQRFTAPKD